ncbi:hypothetical protein BT69DRAFT_1291109 [Atractiella rhizophila]|nr:hypothetical protein BT69DRAFT_1291109 [Atractiella rhizophila]
MGIPLTRCVYLAASVFQYYNEPNPDRPGEFRLAPKAKRLALALGVGGVTCVAFGYLSQFPRRIIKRIALLKFYPLVFRTASIGIFQVSHVKLLKPLSPTYQFYHNRQFPKTDKPMGVQGKWGKWFLIDGKDSASVGDSYLGTSHWSVDKRSLELAFLGFTPKTEQQQSESA